MKQMEKLIWMDWFRGFSILMIVMLHCLTRYMSKGSVSYPYLYALFAHSTNLFLFISGFFFEYLLYKKYTYKSFILKKLKRFLIPYTFWALPVILVLFVYKKFDFSYLIYSFWTGLEHYNNAHWYIHFILLVFLFSPLYVFLQNKNVLYKVVMPFFLIITLFSNRAKINFLYCDLNFFPLIGMFFLGMFFSKYRSFLVYDNYRLYKFFIFMGFLTVIMQGYYHLGNGLRFQNAIISLLYEGKVFCNFSALNKLFFAIGFLQFFYRLSLGKYKFSILKRLAHYSFAIYFSHLYIIFVCNKTLSLVFHISYKGWFFLIIMPVIILLLTTLCIRGLRSFKLTKNIIGV